MPKRALHPKSQLFSIPELNLQKFKFETQTQSIDQQGKSFLQGGWPCNLAVLGCLRRVIAGGSWSQEGYVWFWRKIEFGCALCLDQGKLTRDRKRRLRKADILILPLTGETVARIIQNHWGRKRLPTGPCVPGVGPSLEFSSWGPCK